MKTYLAIFDPIKNPKGVFGISLVENPAMESMFVALNKDEETTIQLKEIDKEQRIVLGLILEPNKKILRNQGGEKFSIVFNEETIKELSYHFFKQKNQKNSTIEHKESIEGVTFVESWIVEDTKKDKSAIYGFSFPKGSWVATMKIDNDEIWNDFVKTGKVKGFSIDAMLSLKEINLKLNKEMSKTTTLKEKILALFKDEEIKLGSVKSEDGSQTFMYESDTPQVGEKVWIVATDESGQETRVPVSAGEHLVEGGMILVVEPDGIIASFGDAAEKPEENQELDQDMNVKAIDEAVAKAVKSIMIKYSEDAEKNKKIHDDKQKASEKKIQELELKMVELSKAPASEGIRPNVQTGKNDTVPRTRKGRITQFLNDRK